MGHICDNLVEHVGEALVGASTRSHEYEFWQSCINFCTIMKAAMAALKEFDGKQSCMGNVYIIMKVLRCHMVALRNTFFNMPSPLVDPLEVVIKRREALVYSNLYYTDALLNLHLIKDMKLCDDQLTMARLMRIFQKLSDIDKEFYAVKVKFNLYFHILSPYFGDHIWSLGDEGSGSHLVVYK